MPATEGVKFDAGKPRFDLIPPNALIEVARVYTMGGEKYAARNWENGMDYGRLYGALQRHLHAFWSGENKDQESDLHHLAHAAFGVLGLLEYELTKTGTDSRTQLRVKA